jgi:hypothetical protein
MRSPALAREREESYMDSNQQARIERLWELQRTTREIVQSHADRMAGIVTGGVLLPDQTWEALIKTWEQANENMQKVGDALTRAFGMDAGGDSSR